MVLQSSYISYLSILVAMFIYTHTIYANSNDSILEKASTYEQNNEQNEAAFYYYAWLKKQSHITQNYITILLHAATLDPNIERANESLENSLSTIVSKNYRSLIFETLGTHYELQNKLSPAQNAYYQGYLSDIRKIRLLYRSAILLFTIGNNSQAHIQAQQLQKQGSTDFYYKGILLEAKVLYTQGYKDQAITLLETQTIPAYYPIAKKILFQQYLFTHTYVPQKAIYYQRLLAQRFPQSLENIMINTDTTTISLLISPDILLSTSQNYETVPHNTNNTHNNTIFIQIGIFREQENAHNIKTVLHTQEFNTIIVPVIRNSQQLYQVLVQSNANEDIQILLKRLKELGYTTAFITNV